MHSDGRVEQKTLRHVDLFPSDWFADGGSAWTECFRILRAPLTRFPPVLQTLEIAGVRALVLYGSPRYLDTGAAKLEIKSESEWRLNLEGVSEKAAPEDRYLILATPVRPSEGEARARIAVAVGFLTALNGRNMAWDRVYAITLEGQDKWGGVSSAWENPLAFEVPDLTQAGQERLTRCAEALAQSPEDVRRRLELSLRWLASAVKDGGADAVLKYWIALETLAMPDGTDIRPIGEALGRSYGIAGRDANERFLVGRLFGLRSRIVHGGILAPIHPRILEFMAAIFLDVLLDTLGQPAEGRSRAVRDRSDVDLSRLLSG